MEKTRARVGEGVGNPGKIGWTFLQAIHCKSGRLTTLSTWYYYTSLRDIG